jgi:uncharacterized protein
MDLEKARAFVLEKIEKELPPVLFYHSFKHVLDVYESAENHAVINSISGEELTLLRTAVLFHDSGFIFQLTNHEEVGCGFARKVLPDFDYSKEQIERICGMIMATRIPQTPTNLLEEIICDADLDYLGRDDFWDIGGNLYRELVELSILKTEEDWNRLQLNFLTKHRYFTKSANDLRAEKKQIHLNKIIEIVETYTN